MSRCIVIDFYDRNGGNWVAAEAECMAFLFEVAAHTTAYDIKKRAKSMMRFLYTDRSHRAGVLYMHELENGDIESIEYDRILCCEGKWSPHAYLSYRGWGYNDG